LAVTTNTGGTKTPENKCTSCTNEAVKTQTEIYQRSVDM